MRKRKRGRPAGKETYPKDPFRLKEARRLRNTGKTYEQIGKVLKITKQGVRKYLKRWKNYNLIGLLLVGFGIGFNL